MKSTPDRLLCIGHVASFVLSVVLVCILVYVRHSYFFSAIVFCIWSVAMISSVASAAAMILIHARSGEHNAIIFEVIVNKFFIKEPDRFQRIEAGFPFDTSKDPNINVLECLKSRRATEAFIRASLTTIVLGTSFTALGSVLGPLSLQIEEKASFWFSTLTLWWMCAGFVDTNRNQERLHRYALCFIWSVKLILLTNFSPVLWASSSAASTS